MLHCFGPATQIIFETLPGAKKTYTEAEFVLQKYFAPACRTQQSELAKSCEYGELASEMIGDQSVEKCYSKKLKGRLLQHDTLDFDQTLIYIATEIAEQEFQLIAVSLLPG